MTSDDHQLRLEYVPLERARLWDENPKKHDLALIQESIYRYGFQDPPKYDQTLGGLVYGNGRTEALLQAQAAGREPPAGVLVDQAGRWLVPVIFGNDQASRDAARALAVDHNNLTLAGSFSAQDMAKLWTVEGYRSLMDSLKLGAELPLTAWVGEPPKVRDAAPRVDHGPELALAWGVTPGSLWRLGSHRLICGDATSETDVDRLMTGQVADLGYTDPPYGESFTGGINPWARVWAGLPNDDLRGQALQDFLTAAFQNMARTSSATAPLYCWHSSGTQREFENALNLAGYDVAQQLIWNKGMVLSWSDYHQNHEPLFYCKKSGQSKSTPWYGDRTGKTILGDFRTDYKKLSKEKLIEIVTALQDGATVWELDRDAVALYQHSAQKPARLAMRAIQNSSPAGGLVADFFLGSGGTLVACENLGRDCRAIEIVPGHVGISLQRMRDAFPALEIERIE